MEAKISRVETIEALVRRLFAKPSGQYLVTVHQGAVTQVASIDRPIHIEDCISQDGVTEPEPRAESEKLVSQNADLT